MPRKPNYRYERAERERLKAERRAEREQRKAASRIEGEASTVPEAEAEIRKSDS